MRERVRRLLGRRWAPGAIIALGFVLLSPALWVGFSTDDHVHRVLSRPDPGVRGFTSRPLDLFVFTHGAVEENRALMDEGVFPWWTSPDAKLAFMRPIASLSHALDHALWPESSALAQLHGLLWFALSLWALWALYRRLFDAPWAAALALLLYAIDDARGPTVGWIANRNATMALALAVPALILHIRWRRDGLVVARYASPALLAIALLCGESALAIVAYLFAFALCLDTGSLRARLLAIAPHGLVVVLWRVVYVVAGYGAARSGVYVDPGAQPVAFVAQAIHRLPTMLSAQLLGVWADLSGMVPFLGNYAFPTLITLLVVVLGVLIAIFLPLLREDRLARFFFTGMLLSAVPVCSTFPADRLLVFIGVGGMGLIARFLETLARPSPLFVRAAAGYLVLVHLVLAPPLLVLRARSMDSVERLLHLTDLGIPRDPAITGKTVVLVNTPGDVFQGYQQLTRASRGIPKPHALRWLSTGLTPVAITRTGERTLQLEPEGGFLQFDVDRMLTDPRVPFSVGQRIAIEGMTVEVLTVSDDGRPARVRFTFDRALDDASLLFMRWDGANLVPYALPPVGERETLPAIDMRALIALSEKVH